MTIVLTDDLRDEPIRMVSDAYAQARASVKPPDGWADDLTAPLKAVEQAVKAASQVAGQLNEVQARVDAGVIHRDQAPLLRKRIVDEARGQVESFTDAGRQVLDALPTRITSRAWPDATPPDADWQTITTEWEVVTPTDAVQSFGGMVTDALGRGDRKSAKALMSRRGKALLATRIGKEQADVNWPVLQHIATDGLRQLGSGTDAAPGIALEQLEAVGKSFGAGANLADMLLNSATVAYDAQASERG